MRTPSQTRDEAESALRDVGMPRNGTGFASVENRGLIRKWLVACGVSSAVAGSLKLTELGYVWRDLSDERLRDLIAREAPIAAPPYELPVAAETPPETPPARPVGILEAAIQTAVETALANHEWTPALDEDEVTNIVQRELARREPQVIRVEIADRPAVEIRGQHPVFERVLRLMMKGANVLLVGPAGCGKSHLCAQLAKATARDFAFISGSAGISESALTGWLLPVEGGIFAYQPSEFVRLYERGHCVLLFDEIDALDPNMLMSAQSMTANGCMSVPHRREAPTVHRGPEVGIVAAANTMCVGADLIYVARNPLDGATLDRYITIEMDYDRAFEERVALSGGLSASELAEIWTLRDKVKEAQLTRIVSTRTVQKAVIMKAAGDDWSAIMSTIMVGWTRDERSKVGRA